MKSRWQELWKFLLSRYFLIPISLIVFLEIFLRLGWYDFFLKPQSYAANILRIKHIIKTSPIKPNFLIVGTSVPHQGILLDLLNDLAQANDLHWKFQSIATQAAFLETQTLLLEYTLQYHPQIKYIIHFADLDFPWQQSRNLETANRSMLAQFELQKTMELLKKNEYQITFEDYRFFYVKIFTYQQDLKDFLLNPFGRWKSIKKHQEKSNSLYPYINDAKYSIGIYAKTIHECIENATKGIPFFQNQIQITDEPHRKAVLDTCRLSEIELMNEPEREQKERLFILRLSNLYKIIQEQNLGLIVVFPPYSFFAKNLRKEEKFEFWKKTLFSLNPNVILLDLRFVLDDEENLTYFYDTIHLNQYGAEVFTRIFFKKLLGLQKNFVFRELR
ncbi:MAG: hypothetical protein NZ853_04905 [Leptospiraceae bacterium]|nr:hypothetical protein [Leptospiraceae bacterium]MDW7976714.1 hypothetical protein [Leptospiraceae bacterium]